MKRKNETDTLNDSIEILKSKRSHELQLIKYQFRTTYEALKPINLIKSAFKNISSSAGLNQNIVGDIIGLTTGYLSKKLLVGTSHNPLKRMFGTLLQFVIAKVVSKNSDFIKSTGEHLVHRFLKERKESKQEFHTNMNS